MEKKEISREKEFQLLNEYMRIYIQLLPYCKGFGGCRIHKPQLPTFEYFKENYAQITIPQFKESKWIYANNRVGPIHTHGLGSDNGIAYRFYNIWVGGCKYFTGGNIEGNYTIETETLNLILKKN